MDNPAPVLANLPGRRMAHETFAIEMRQVVGGRIRRSGLQVQDAATCGGERHQFGVCGAEEGFGNRIEGGHAMGEVSSWALRVPSGASSSRTSRRTMPARESGSS